MTKLLLNFTVGGVYILTALTVKPDEEIEICVQNKNNFFTI